MCAPLTLAISSKTMADDDPTKDDAPDEQEEPTSRSAAEERKAMNALTDNVRVW